MAENGFNKDDLLSLSDLLKNRMREVNEAREELNKASKKLDDFVEKKFVKPNEVFIMSVNSFYVLCRVSPPLDLYFRMVQTGRHLWTGEAVALAERYKIASESTVQRYLIRLYSFGLIKRNEHGKYWAIPPSRLGLSDIL